ncbi:MAG TPA: squalene/phytoene synthase family protein [Rhizomicrobium sp.]|jgi:phytoene synthase
MARRPVQTPCEALVRRHDPDRYFATLFAPAQTRPHLFALYAFNYEIARVGEAVREPMMGEIRLQWWREAIAGARDGRPREHEVARALAEMFTSAALPPELFDAVIEARRNDLDPSPFADLAALEDYADATSGNVMRLAARILGAGVRYDDLAREAGIAYALAGLLQAIPYHAARGAVLLPRDMLQAGSLSRDDVLAGKSAGLRPVIESLAARARTRLAAARKLPRPKQALAAFLPAALVPLKLKRLTAARFDPFRHKAEVPLHRRQLALLSAALRGGI